MRCPKCGAENPFSSVQCQCGQGLAYWQNPKNFKPAESKDRPDPEKSLVTAGYVCAFVALVFIPPGFAVAALVIGIISLVKGSIRHGIALIVLAVACGLIGFSIGAYVQQKAITEAERAWPPR